MSFGLSIKLLIEPLRTVSSGSISSVYTPIGTPLVNPARQFLIQNLTNVLLYFSIDGVNDHIALPASGFLLDDVTSNKALTNAFYLAQNTIIYVRAPSGNPASGAVYFTSFYAWQE